ncbi:MarR family winged helix-turn-helix transcriptional regulator [Streptomyces flavofungini]
MEQPDAEYLANQPAVYWTGAAHTAVVAFMHAEQSALGTSQRHWMTLNRLAVTADGLTRNGLTEALRASMTPQVGDPSTYAEVLDDLLDRGWITPDRTGRFTLTDTGRAARARLAALAPRLRARIHDGIPEDDYVRTVRVLRRMIANVSDQGRA